MMRSRRTPLPLALMVGLAACGFAVACYGSGGAPADRKAASTPAADSSPSVAGVPPLPTIRLRVAGTLHEGRLGNHCWPRAEAPGVVVSTCEERPFPDPPAAIVVARGTRVAVEIEARNQPLGLSVLFFRVPRRPPFRRLRLEKSLKSSFSMDLAEGRYVVHLVGEWVGGNGVTIELASVTYAFGLEVVSTAP